MNFTRPIVNLVVNRYQRLKLHRRIALAEREIVAADRALDEFKPDHALPTQANMDAFRELMSRRTEVMERWATVSRDLYRLRSDGRQQLTPG